MPVEGVDKEEILESGAVCLSPRTLVNFFIDNWMLFSLAITSGGMLLWPVLRGASGPGLAPTAGYVEDGRRFLAEVKPILLREAIPEAEFARVV